jgi:hypothetical protein
MTPSPVMAYAAPSERVGFDLAAAPLYSIVIFVDSPRGGIAQLVERLVRKKIGRLWTQKVLSGQSGTNPPIDMSSGRGCSDRPGLKWPEFSVPV